MPKYIDISTKNIPPITYNPINNRTTVNSQLYSMGKILVEESIQMYDMPLYLSYDTNTKIQYDWALDGVVIQTYGGGKIGTVGGVSNLIGWNTNSASITGNFNVSGATTLSGSLIAGATTISNTSLGFVSGATSNLQSQLNKISISNLGSQSTGTNNFAIGSSSCNALTTGSNNITVGYTANNLLVSGSHNIGIGFQASVGTGDENICIGRNSTTSGAFSASTAIGKNSSITASNQIVLGTNVNTTKILGAIDVSGTTTLTGALICNQIYETTIATTGTTSPFTCNMALGSTFYIPTDYTFASNFQIIITNVPTDTTKSYTISVIYRQPTTLFYISTARVSDTASTYLLGSASTYSSPLFNGGLPTLANSPNLIIQSFSIISTATSTNTFTRFITSSVNNHY